MARSLIKRRQEAERERLEAYQATLRRVSRAERPAPDFDKALKEAKKGFEGEIVRDCASWRPRLKTRDANRLRLAAARHLFARYPAPAHLEAVWLESEGQEAEETKLRKRWYITVAGGGSLYKAQGWLSRKEVHWFLNPPGELGFAQAFWVAIARTYTDGLGVALRIGRSKLARTARGDLAFWREVARFFCANQTTLEAMDDLCDYLAAAFRRDRHYSLKGRTLASLNRAMAEWHRELQAIERIEAAQRRAEQGRARANGQATTPDTGRWAGSTLLDWSWKPSAREAANRREEFVVSQLSTAAELVAESSAMRHCVSSYAAKCIAGHASIWSMRRRVPGKVDRLLTIELDRQHRAVQVRGFANRLASADEKQVLGRWAKARGIILPAY
ncbi:MAG: PcfJ domain-containing protein [Rhizobiaceae bacterium]